MIAAELANIQNGANQPTLGSSIELPRNTPPLSHAKAASMLNISERSVRAASHLLDGGAAELVSAVERGMRKSGRG